MKKIVLVLLILFFSFRSFSQDRIYLKDYSIIEAVVKDVTGYMIKYAKFSDPNGDVLAITLDEVAKIIYENGNVREFSKNAWKKEGTSGSERDSYFALAAGFGRSYGGIGIQAQGRFGKKQGFGLHGGVGLNPLRNSGVCFGIGAKFFYYRWLYINAQVGAVYWDEVSYYWEYMNEWEYSDQSFFGISILAGGDFFFGDHVGLNVAIGPTFIPDASEYNSSVALGIDLGFVFKF
jgi:hypothetical protein